MNADGEPSLLAELTGAAESPGTRINHILVVDDDAPLRRSMPHLLAAPGRRFDLASSLGEAIESLSRQHYDLILLDHRLPDGNGLSLLDWRAENQRDDAVVMLSGEDGIDVAIGALRRGAEDFLRKPYHLAQLQHTVDKALHKTGLERANRRIGLRLKESERLYRYLVESSPDIIFMLDARGRFRYVNPRAESLLGYERRQLLGRAVADIAGEDDRPRLQALFCNPERPTREARSLELKLQRNAGGSGGKSDMLTFSVNTEPVLGRQGACGMRRLIGTYGVARDISDRKRAEDVIVYQAYHDQLTRLPNRLLFHDRLELALAQAQRRGSVLAVLFIDLDRFKLVNDTYGHGDGDHLLRGVASRLRQSLRRGDTLARVGGDEFVALLPDLTSPDDAERIAIKILQTLHEPFQLKHGEFRVTVSVGIALYPKDGEMADLLIQHADIAMYQVKRSGKNGYCFFGPELNANYRQRVSLENDLRQALERDEFELRYQPLVDTARRRVLGAEALLRWRHPDHGLLNPTEFVTVAEEIGLIGGISNWVLDRACAQLARWRRMGHRDIRMSVNLSPRDFEHGDVVGEVSRRLANYRLPAPALMLEITEHLMMQEGHAGAEKIAQLRQLGVGVAIDDFGTGYSALGYLQRFQISSLKIDRCFVSEMKSGGNPIISAIAGIARGFGLGIVAEGVETPEQLDQLSVIGCDAMQGFYFSPPASAEVVEGLFREAPADWFPDQVVQ
ncbi:MAG: EAL domain-containing protein [Rhodocyclaceae bacterium]|nr:EAL domain-containing protein [Rhodocyclaceae bacterium]